MVDSSLEDVVIVGVDRETGLATNVSILDSLAHAQAISQLAPMLAQRPILQAPGLTFEAVTNHSVLWSITP